MYFHNYESNIQKPDVTLTYRLPIAIILDTVQLYYKVCSQNEAQGFILIPTFCS